MACGHHASAQSLKIGLHRFICSALNDIKQLRGNDIGPAFLCSRGFLLSQDLFHQSHMVRRIITIAPQQDLGPALLRHLRHKPQQSGRNDKHTNKPRQRRNPCFAVISAFRYPRFLHDMRPLRQKCLQALPTAGFGAE